MITYVASQVHRLLREALTLAAVLQVTVNRTKYIVRVDGAVHRVRRDGICTCGGTPQQPCAATPLVQAYLANGGWRPPGRDESTWPDTWTSIPAHCPVCDCLTLPDRHLNSRAGPGWKCSLTGYEHFWQVRMNPLRKFLAANPPKPRYPYYDTTEEERQAWLEAHRYPPRLAPTTSEGEIDHALDGAKTCPCQHCPQSADTWLDPVWIQRGSVRLDDRLLRPAELGRDR